MKICRDCKHFGGPTSAGAMFGCYKELDKVAYIDGINFYKYAQWVREDARLCGPEGKWWEAK